MHGGRFAAGERATHGPPGDRGATERQRAGIRAEGEVVEVRVAARPRDGAANEAVRRALAEALGLPLRTVTLVRGGTSKHKAFAIEGLEKDAIVVRLRAVAEAVAGAASSKDE